MRVLSYPELREKKGLVWSRAHVYRQIQAGKFPKPVKLGPGTTVWLESEVDAWLARFVNERDSAAADTTEPRDAA